jgi:GT2 family glycosyltransferase
MTKQIKLSAVIPHWPKTPEHEAALKRCVESLGGVDEIIVEVNEGIGFAKACNLGLAKTHGDYILVVNNDTVVTHGNLDNLCVPDTVVVPRMATGQVDNMPRAFYCMPRSVYEKVGGYDERFEGGYFEDDDLIRRWMEAGVPIIVKEIVEVNHVGGMTMDTLDKVEIYNKNQQRYEEKWGIQ